MKVAIKEDRVQNITSCQDFNYNRDISDETLREHTRYDNPFKVGSINEEGCDFQKLIQDSIRIKEEEKLQENGLVITKVSQLSEFQLQNGSNSSGENKAFQCTICELKLTHKSSLNKHVLIHTGIKPFFCTMCNYRAFLKSNLNKHMRIHTGEKPFCCTFCEYRSSCKSTLKKHIRTHTGEKPYCCTVCNDKFSLKPALNRHMLIHTGEKPYKCTACDHKCSKKVSFDKHMLIHKVL